MGLSFQAAQQVVAAFAIGRELGPIQALGADAIDQYRKATTLPVASLPRVVDWSLRPSQLAYCRGRGIPDQHSEWCGLATMLT